MSGQVVRTNLETIFPFDFVHGSMNNSSEFSLVCKTKGTRPRQPLFFAILSSILISVVTC